jgi:hypothetical protein
MVAYTGIQGQNILIVSSDPANPVEGQIWYNTTSNTLKDYQTVVVAAAWASGANYPFSGAGNGAAGTQTAAVSFLGYNVGTDDRVTTTNEYDGTSWTAGGNMATKRASAGAAGTQTAALGFGGYYEPPPTLYTNTEKYDGTSWTNNPTGLATARTNLMGAGTQTAGLAFGGSRPAGFPSPVGYTNTELFNGTSWTANPTGLPTARRTAGSAGTQTNALCFGGAQYPAPATNIATTDSFNGTTWTAGGNLNTARQGLSGAGTSSTAAVAFGGSGPTYTTATEIYDGTTWTNSTPMLNTKGGGAGAGTQTAALMIIGYTGTAYGNAVEEFTGPSSGLQTRTITTS